MSVRKPAQTLFQIEAAEEAVDKRTQPKEFRTERDSYGLYVVKLSAGGEVPALLSGKFTSASRAETAINEYKARRDASASS